MKREVEPAQTRPVVLLGLLIASFLAVAIGLPIAFPKKEVVPEVGPKAPPTIRVAPNVQTLGTEGDTTTFVGDVVIYGTLTVLGPDDDDDDGYAVHKKWKFSCGPNCPHGNSYTR